jgi:hypothetical protein
MGANLVYNQFENVDGRIDAKCLKVARREGKGGWMGLFERNLDTRGVQISIDSNRSLKTKLLF